MFLSNKDEARTRTEQVVEELNASGARCGVVGFYFQRIGSKEGSVKIYHSYLSIE